MLIPAIDHYRQVSSSPARNSRPQPSFMFIENIYPQLRDWLAEGQKVAIATLVQVDGSSPRPIGSQMGISDTGDFVGTISSGCVENAIVEEALQAIKIGDNWIVRYGEGSRYIDVKLPCGSSLLVTITSQDVDKVVSHVLDQHQRRKPAYLITDEDSMLIPVDEALADFSVQPDYVLHIFGAGAECASLTELARAAGYQVALYSPDDQIESLPMPNAAALQAMTFDSHSAVVTLFHDHDYELSVLQAALNSNAQYIGALGSKRTHETRLQALAAGPDTKRPSSDIDGPAGLFIGASTPHEIAISILAKITQERRASA